MFLLKKNKKHHKQNKNKKRPPPPPKDFTPTARKLISPSALNVFMPIRAEDFAGDLYVINKRLRTRLIDLFHGR